MAHGDIRLSNFVWNSAASRVFVLDFDRAVWKEETKARQWTALCQEEANALDDLLRGAAERQSGGTAVSAETSAQELASSGGRSHGQSAVGSGGEFLSGAMQAAKKSRT